jgi:hypothetical protein
MDDPYVAESQLFVAHLLFAQLTGTKLTVSQRVSCQLPSRQHTSPRQLLGLLWARGQMANVCVGPSHSQPGSPLDCSAGPPLPGPYTSGKRWGWFDLGEGQHGKQMGFYAFSAAPPNWPGHAPEKTADVLRDIFQVCLQPVVRCAAGC